MRKIVIPIVLSILGLGLVSGCQTVGVGGKPTTQQLQQDIVDVKVASQIATRVYLLSIKDPSEQQKTKQFVYNVASQTFNVVDKNKITVEEVRQYADSLINNYTGKNKQEFGLLLDSVVLVVEDRLQQNDLVDLTGDQRTAAVTGLIKAAAAGVMEASKP